MTAETSETGHIAPEISSMNMLLPTKPAKEFVACAAEILSVRSGYLSN